MFLHLNMLLRALKVYDSWVHYFAYYQSLPLVAYVHYIIALHVHAQGIKVIGLSVYPSVRDIKITRSRV